jgi:hypothetical protein
MCVILMKTDRICRGRKRSIIRMNPPPDFALKGTIRVMAGTARLGDNPGPRPGFLLSPSGLTVEFHLGRMRRVVP